MRGSKATLLIAVLSVLTLSSGCSKHHGTNPSETVSPPVYKIRVAPHNLSGTGLTLQINNQDDLYLTPNQQSTFKNRYPDGTAYNITVVAQPTKPSQTCTVNNSSGIVQGRNVSLVAECTTNKYTVGGTVSGLNGQVVLRNRVFGQALEELPINSDGASHSQKISRMEMFT